MWDRDTIVGQGGAEGLMVCMADRIDEELLAGFPRLRVVAGVFKGYDDIDVAACTRRGVWVTVLADLLTAPTAELVVGLMLAVMRRVPEGDALVRSGGSAVGGRGSMVVGWPGRRWGWSGWDSWDRRSLVGYRRSTPGSPTATRGPTPGQEQQGRSGWRSVSCWLPAMSWCRWCR